MPKKMPITENYAEMGMHRVSISLSDRLSTIPSHLSFPASWNWSGARACGCRNAVQIHIAGGLHAEGCLSAYSEVLASEGCDGVLHDSVWSYRFRWQSIRCLWWVLISRLV